MTLRGTGAYVRGHDDTIPEHINADFVLVPFMSSDEAIARYRTRFPGKPMYLFGLPDAFRPGVFAATLDTMKAKVERLGLTGVVANPESGWRVDAATKRALADKLIALSRTMDVGIVSYPSWPGLSHNGENFYANSSVWGAPEIYGVSSQDADDYRSWYARWFRAFSGKVGITFNAGGTISGAIRQSQSDYLRYLNNLPVAPFGIAWGTTGNTFEVIRSVIAGSLGVLPGRKGVIQASLMSFFSSDWLIAGAVVLLVLLAAIAFAIWWFA